MHIKKIISQYRRDFKAIYTCEWCNEDHVSTGYDDEYFHKNIIPTMKCPSCKKIAGKDYRPLTTKYPENFII